MGLMCATQHAIRTVLRADHAEPPRRHHTTGHRALPPWPCLRQERRAHETRGRARSITHRHYASDASVHTTIDVGP